jgi:hypothetical protein
MPGMSHIITEVIFGRFAIMSQILIIHALAPILAQIVQIAIATPTQLAINNTVPRMSAII